MTRTAVVTGANSGIGLETARGLARQGFEVVLLCRNEGRGRAAVDDIATSVPEANLHLVLADLGRPDEVRRGADEIADLAPSLDVLVNNAALTIRRRTETPDGLDTMLAVNHLGPFLLTNLLLPRLEAAAPSRIVTVASEAHKMGRLDLDDLQAERGYGLLGFPRYGETKLMNILFTRALARRLEGTGVVANSLHPGAVSTNLGDPPELVRKLLGLFFLSPAEGAQTSLTVATDPAYESTTGTYFVKSKPANHKLSDAAEDDDAAERLWDASAELVGL